MIARRPSGSSGRAGKGSCRPAAFHVPFPARSAPSGWDRQAEKKRAQPDGERPCEPDEMQRPRKTVDPGSGRSVEIDAHGCVRGMATACVGHVLQPDQPIGSIVRKPVKRRKPRSCDASRRPCSIARTASSMSGTSSLRSPGASRTTTTSPRSRHSRPRPKRALVVAANVIPQQRCLYRC